MKVVEKERYIPARTYIDKTYVALDGKVFNQESDCLRYEKQLETEKHPVFASAINNAYVYDDGRSAVLYYFSSQEDYDFFIKAKNLDEV